MANTYDVIIVGAGPVGLLLACELALADVSVLVLEREEKVESQWKVFPLGLRGLNVPSVESLYRRGLLNKIFEDGKRPASFHKTEGFSSAGHFAGMMINANKIDFSRWKYYLAGPSAFGGGTTCGHVEGVLAERAQELGVQIRRGASVSKFVDDGEKVKVWTGDEELTAQWLVGCDGGRSMIRKAAGFEFVGTEGDFTGYVAKCELDKPELLKPGFNRTDKGMYIKIAATAVYVIDFVKDPDRTQGVTQEQYQEALRRVSGTDITVKTLHLANSFTDRSKQVTQYRKGRIFLAGDSAHIHSPLGAQGMNAGLGDAMNLGWKLAATVKGVAPTGLLDTYHAERHPLAAWVLEWTRAQAATLRPDAQGHAVGKVVRDMIDTVDGTTYFAGHIWGVSQRYDFGDVHELVGRSAPDFEFSDGSRLGSKMGKGGFMIVDFEEDAALKDFANRLEPKVQYYGGRAKETFGLKALLLRPDGIVAWAAEDKYEIDGLRTALSRWLSQPELESQQ